MNILVIGFQRSGTTLLKDLIGKHPNVKHMFHEVALMKFPKEHILKSSSLPDKDIKNNYQGVIKTARNIDFDMLNDNWGEKVPYWVPRIFKGFRGSVKKYCQTWNQYFGKKARIINIVRHPLDVAISTKKRGFTKNINKPLKQYKRTMPIVLDQLANISNIKHIQFEKLVTNPERVLRNIYRFCEIQHDPKTVKDVIENKGIFRFNKIDSSRAFSHINENRDPDKFDLDEILKLVNTLEGISYDI